MYKTIITIFLFSLKKVFFTKEKSVFAFKMTEDHNWTGVISNSNYEMPNFLLRPQTPRRRLETSQGIYWRKRTLEARLSEQFDVWLFEFFSIFFSFNYLRGVIARQSDLNKHQIPNMFLNAVLIKEKYSEYKKNTPMFGIIAQNILINRCTSL